MDVLEEETNSEISKAMRPLNSSGEIPNQRVDQPLTWVGGWQCLGAPDGSSLLLQALLNGAPPSSKPSSPALIETKESNGSIHTSSSISEEPEEQDAQVWVGLSPGMWAEMGRQKVKSPELKGRPGP